MEVGAECQVFCRRAQNFTQSILIETALAEVDISDGPSTANAYVCAKKLCCFQQSLDKDFAGLPFSQVPSNLLVGVTGAKWCR